MASFLNDRRHIDKEVGCETVSLGVNWIYTLSHKLELSLLKLKTMWQSVKKGSLHLNEYLLKGKSIVDGLASIGYTISSSDHLQAIFNVLAEEYDTFVICVNSYLET